MNIVVGAAENAFALLLEVAHCILFRDMEDEVELVLDI